MWYELRRFFNNLSCSIFGHNMGTRPNLVACDPMNISNIYNYRICERCGVQELDGKIVSKSVMLMPKQQWSAQMYNPPVNPTPPPTVEELNRLLHQITTGTSGKYRSIDDPWDDLR